MLAAPHIDVGMESEELLNVQAGNVVDPLSAVSSKGSISCREDDPFCPDRVMPKGHFDVVDWNCRNMRAHRTSHGQVEFFHHTDLDAFWRGADTCNVMIDKKLVQRLLQILQKLGSCLR